MYSDTGDMAGVQERRTDLEEKDIIRGFPGAAKPREAAKKMSSIGKNMVLRVVRPLRQIAFWSVVGSSGYWAVVTPEAGNREWEPEPGKSARANGDAGEQSQPSPPEANWQNYLSGHTEEKGLD